MVRDDHVHRGIFNPWNSDEYDTDIPDLSQHHLYSMKNTHLTQIDFLGMLNNYI